MSVIRLETEAEMLAENKTKNANYLRVISILKSLRDSGDISWKEYSRAKAYYKKLTGADIVIAD